LITEDDNGFIKQYAYSFGFAEIPSDIVINGYPAIEHDQIFFAGYINDDNFTEGIWTIDYDGQNLTNILNLTNTDTRVELIKSATSSFVALTTSNITGDHLELYRHKDNTLNSFYSVPSGYRVQNLKCSDDKVIWSEVDDGFVMRRIQMYDFTKNELKTIGENGGLDPYSIGLMHNQVVWWENTVGVTKIMLWKDDSTKTIRNTLNGLYLNDNGFNPSSTEFAVDDNGFAWMEDDFTVHYYQFSDNQLYSFDLSEYFNDTFLTYYLVKQSKKYIIIEALSDITQEKVGTYLFNLNDIITGIENGTRSEIPLQFVLEQNFPNPFNPATKIIFSIPARINVKLDIYDILGRRVTSLVNKELSAGKHSISFNASEFASGVYFYKLEAGSFLQTKKMVLIK